MSAIQTVVDWLTDGARSSQLSEEVLTELCGRMVEAGIPPWRAAVFVTTLRPDFMGRAFYWRDDTGIKVIEAGYDMMEREEYLRSPPAVNLAARPEKRAASLGRAVVASAAFATHAPGEFIPLGEFPVAGFSAPLMVFGMADPTRPVDEHAAVNRSPSPEGRPETARRS
jgi:hypothetical protein